MRLCERLLPGAATMDIEAMPGGQHELYRVRNRSRSYSLKIMRNRAHFSAKDGASALRRELFARRGFGGQLPLPAVLHSGQIRDGSRYFMCEWVDGQSLRHHLLKASLLTGPAFEQAGRLLGQFHDRSRLQVKVARRVLPTAPVVSLGFGLPDFTKRLLDTMTAVRHRFGPRLLDDVAETLDTAMPCCARFTDDLLVCHGDFQPKNLIFSEAGTLVSVIDWELCVIGSRLGDLAHLLRYADSYVAEDHFGDAYATFYPLPAGWKSAMRCYDLARVGLGLSQPGISSASDIPLWMDFVRGCIDILRDDDPVRLRCVGKQLYGLSDHHLEA
jgi:Ser/Thr protein kinase RdoA (MazF antagonist)